MAVDLIVEDSGKKRKKSDVDFVDDVIKLKNQKGIWAAIELLIQRWVKSAPEEIEALKIQIDDHKEQLTDKKFGQTAGGKDFERRFTIVFPLKLMLMIRAVFANEEVEFDSAFYREFAKRYPNFKVAEKI